MSPAAGCCRGVRELRFWNSLLGNAAYFIIEEGVTAFVYMCVLSCAVARLSLGPHARRLTRYPATLVFCSYRYFRGPKPGDKDLPVSLRRTTHQPRTSTATLVLLPPRY